jgi:parallel beta-helix repeat protein
VAEPEPSAAGNGVYSDQGLSNAFVRSNVITGHFNASVLLTAVAHLPETFPFNVTISANDISHDTAIRLTHTSNSTIDSNLITNSNGSGIAFAGDVHAVTVNRNRIEACAFTGINVADFDATGVPNSNNTINNNTVRGCKDGGIRLRDGADENSLVDNRVEANSPAGGISLESGAHNNLVSRNNSQSNQKDGLFAASGTFNNVFDRNTARFNTEHDCHDDSGPGNGTLGTNNTWTANNGLTSHPPGLCRR